MDNNKRIIEEVRKYDCLYNLQSECYKNFQYKADLWCKIGKNVGVPAEEAKRKFRNLRDTYKKWKQKDNWPSGSTSLLRKPYRYAENLKFLDEFPSSGHNNSFFKVEENYDDETEAATSQINQTEPEVKNFDVSVYNEQDLSNDADFEIENFDLNDYVKKIDAPTTANANTNLITSNPNATEAPNNNTHINCYRLDNEQNKKKKYDKEALIHDACQEMTSLLQNAKKHFTPPSSNQVFFNSLALQVEEANLPALTQMRLQQRILEMVTMEIVNHQQNNNVQEL